MTNSRILGSDSSRAVLAHLLLKPDGEFYLREIVRLTGFAPRTIQVALDQLVEEDLLKDRRDGNRRYFQANTSHPFFGPLRDLFQRSEGLADVLASALGEEEIDWAIVFGSIPEGTATAQSAVDLLIVGDLGLKEAVARLSGTAETLGREVNPIVWTRDEYERRSDEEDYFLMRVQEGETLYVVGEPDESR
ncbi:MAG: nucleotidyltransferase domain-containing protein [bacterium]